MRNRTARRPAADTSPICIIWLQAGRKPNSVPRRATVIYLGRTVARRLHAAYPELIPSEDETGRGGPLLPIWPCSRWGLPCRTCHQIRGELLPRHFTLTAAEAEAVYFLWHFPYPCGRWPLAITVPHGVRTFLPDPERSKRLPGPPVANYSLVTCSSALRQSHWRAALTGTIS
jgi:hypothetical protein